MNSIYKKTVENTIDKLGYSYTNLIRNQLNGRCNLLLRAEFAEGGGLAEINLWDDKQRAPKRDGLESFKGGVEHILEFCKE